MKAAALVLLSSSVLAGGYGQLPLAFEPNQGQTDAQVKYLARGDGYALFLTGSGAVLKLGGAVVRMRLAGANAHARARGLDRLPGKSHYFTGNNPAQWRTNIAQYARVWFEEVYPGISLVYYGTQRQLEYDFVVAPGADPGGSSSSSKEPRMCVWIPGATWYCGWRRARCGSGSRWCCRASAWLQGATW